MSAHPDARLFAAWSGYVEASNAIGAGVNFNGLSDEELEPQVRVARGYGEVIENTPAKTPRGMALKLRYRFAVNCLSIAAFNAAVHGADMHEEFLSDPADEMLWRMIGEAERMDAVT
ncbi:hypothetical protein [Azospirillum canadense]|uniref:hypothetical protein n=1 Tax=Azospirillum canadense TaxID=403962 RepID=UPI00222617F9|nr:hypothetical protein [Azospirillum canadense]MCW2242267.1 hypothetical protein [Azospirillum canadense]